MTTSLHKVLKRELTIKGRPFILTISPEGLKLTAKGKRKGQELRWEDWVSGDAALAVALNASVGAFAETETQPKPSRPMKRGKRRASARKVA